MDIYSQNLNGQAFWKSGHSKSVWMVPWRWHLFIAMMDYPGVTFATSMNRANTHGQCGTIFDTASLKENTNKFK